MSKLAAVFLVLFLFILSSSVVIQAVSLTWDIQTVDPVGRVNESASIALDSYGNPHISYHDYKESGDRTFSYSLKYASWTGSSWTIQVVDKGASGSLALDSHNTPHISYYDYENKALKYASWTGLYWRIQVVDSVGDVGLYSSLVLDAAGNPHISYYDGENRDLKYARWVNNAWRIQVVDSNGDVGTYASLALDLEGNPHISYYDNTNGVPYYGMRGLLKYASWAGVNWTIEVVDFIGAYGGGCSLVLDSSENPHISYVYNHFERNRSIMYAYWNGTGWEIQSVDSNDAWSPSLVLDSNEKPHMCYVRQRDYKWINDNCDLMYASWTGLNWTKQTVDSTGDIMGLVSLVMDSADVPYMCYYDYANGTLKYATLPGDREPQNPPKNSDTTIIVNITVIAISVLLVYLLIQIIKRLNKYSLRNKTVLR
jgi:hypothetical protein